MSRKANATLVGAFVLVALLVAVIGVLLLGGRALFHHTHSFVLYFDGDVNGLAVGSPVKFQGVRIGAVTRIRLRFTADGPTMIVPVTIVLDESLLASKSGTDVRFEKSTFQRAVEQGLRGRLDTESFVTGQRYVALLQLPGTPVRLLGLEPELDEIPTLPATSEDLRQIVDQLKNLRLGTLVDDLVLTSRAARELLESPELAALPGSIGRTMKGIDGMVEGLHATAQRTQEVEDELSRTLQAAQAFLDPDAPLVVELQTTLREFGSTARSLRTLADFVERDPGALLRGRELPGKP